MKKLNLGKLKLASEEVLQRSQLAGIYGGSGSGGSCLVTCVGPTGHTTYHNVPTCSVGCIQGAGYVMQECSGPSYPCDVI
ncbi:hypothetical protein ACFSKL_15665 [Belliella marina]|uniref:Natural product n=1 Tax=Belliella marina TaxID=1644146 RepID=A0ABW4VR48_9BACT